MVSLCFSLVSALLLAATAAPNSIAAYSRDSIRTSAGNVEVTFIGHGTLMLRWDGKTIHVDPYSKLADYDGLPKADIILLTHHHGDHLDKAAIEKIRTPKSRVYMSAKCAEQIRGTVMENGDEESTMGIDIKAVPAYNLVHKRPDGSPFHPKGEGNGYVITIGRTRIYVAGDTENTPEMKALKGIDVAFLPMNLPYTMTPEMVADAARAFRPKILYPYHYGETDTSILSRLLKDLPGIEVRIRPMP